LSFDKKTQFSKEKYLKKKQQKYFFFFVCLPATTENLTSTIYSSEPKSIWWDFLYLSSSNMRIDSLSAILLQSNIQS